ncbi:NUDIX hydrolase [Amycolatopsis sp. NPDC059090]|uniref:NUDIX hydrolase n=1 Tax=unclassified Amycolatopsis TaxID=2618356 RepID=UPI0036719C09
MGENEVAVAEGVRLPQPRPDVVGAVVLNAEGRAFVQLRDADRRLFPNTWDVVSGHVEDDETPVAALAREVAEETGWRLRRIVRNLGSYRWPEQDGVEQTSVYFVVEVDGDLSRPVLEWDKHSRYAWAGAEDLDILLENCTPDDTLIRDVVARALDVHRQPGGSTEQNSTSG